MREKISPAEYLNNCFKAEMNDPGVELKPARLAEMDAYKKLTTKWIRLQQLWHWHPEGQLTPREYGNALLEKKSVFSS